MAPGLSESDRERLSVHESAHVIAAHSLGRPVGGVRIAAGGGEAEVGMLREESPARLDDVVDELIVLLIGRIATRSPSPSPSPALGWDEERDEERALALAARHCRSPEEISTLIEYARARARTLASQSRFIEEVESLWPLLAEQGSISAEHLNAHLNGKESTNGKSQG